jgi:hypothetical protein
MLQQEDPDADLYSGLCCQAQKLDNQLMRQRMGEMEFYIYKLCSLLSTVEVVEVCWLSWPTLGHDQLRCQHIGPTQQLLPLTIGDQWIAVHWWA